MSRVKNTKKYENFVSWDSRYKGNFDKDELVVHKYFFENVFRNKQNGFIIDIGANDGVTISHSLPFIDKGWSALMIEPNPLLFNKMKDLYSHIDDVVCVNLAVDKHKSDNVELYLGSNSHQGHSTIVFSETQYSYSGQYFSDERVIVQSDTLNNILHECKIEKHIDILHIDAEGKTLDILESFDFDKRRPSYISADILTQDFDPHRHRLIELMEASQYKFILSQGQSIWKDSNEN